ncbi:AAA family ATPase [Piscibacillus sp. B03]|uniref:AAA family ATPase n=1 Tax=Piscibacillus sp. B03 TaxID=3457430 RepID=UPI003FCE13C4
MKVHIIGSVGSGKTTLAKSLSKKYDIPHYELDNVVWKREQTGDIRRSEDERIDYLSSIVRTSSWIIEGVHNEEWVFDSFKQADVIIFLDTNYHIRTIRITKRFIKQKLGFEKANYKPTFDIFFKMFKWNRIFENRGKEAFLNNYSKYKYKIFIVNNFNQAYKLMEKNNNRSH